MERTTIPVAVAPGDAPWAEDAIRRGGGEPAGLDEPFRVRVTVVRRSAEPVPGAARTVTISRLHETLAGARAVVLTLALTPQTRGIIGPKELDVMDRQAWLVNVARGGLVDTAAL